MALPVVPSEQRSQVLSEVLKLAARDGLGLPPELISDRAIEYLSESIESTPDQTLLSRALVGSLLNEKSFEQADRIETFNNTWLADDRAATATGEPDAFLKKMLAFVPVRDVDNRANDAAALAALERFQNSNLFARLARTSESFRNSDFRFAKNNDDSLLALCEVLANWLESSAGIASGDLNQKTSAVYAGALHNYIDAAERVITSLEAVTFEPAKSRLTPVVETEARDPLTIDPTEPTTGRSQCHFTQLFGIVHSAGHNDASRSRSPARSRRQRAPVPLAEDDGLDDTVTEQALVPQAPKNRDLALQRDGDRGSLRVLGVDTQGLTAKDVFKEIFNLVFFDFTAGFLKLLLATLKYTSTILGLLLLIPQLTKTTPTAMYGPLKIAWNEWRGQIPYRSAEEAGFFESFVFGNVISAPDASDIANQAAYNAFKWAKNSGEPAVSGTFYVPGAIFTVEDAIRSRFIKLVFGILRWQFDEAFTGTVLDDVLSVVVLFGWLYFVAYSYKQASAFITGAYETGATKIYQATKNVALGTMRTTRDVLNAMLVRVIVVGAAPVLAVGQGITLANRKLAPQDSALLTAYELYLLKSNNMIDQAATNVRLQDLSRDQRYFLSEKTGPRGNTAARSRD